MRSHPFSPTRAVRVCAFLAQADEHFAACPRGRSIPPSTGGSERAASVWRRSMPLQRPTRTWVMVHDAARPCVSREEIDRLILAAAAGGARCSRCGCRYAEGRRRGTRVEARCPRGGGARPTPQMFRAGRLRLALRQAQAGRRVPRTSRRHLNGSASHPWLPPSRAEC